MLQMATIQLLHPTLIAVIHSSCYSIFRNIAVTHEVETLISEVLQLNCPYKNHHFKQCVN